MGLVSGKLSCPSCGQGATQHRIWFCTLAGVRVYSVDPDASWNYARNVPTGQYTLQIEHKPSGPSVPASSPASPVVVPPSSLVANITSPCTLPGGQDDGDVPDAEPKWRHYEDSDFLERTPAKVRSIFRKAAVSIPGFRYALQICDAESPLPDGDIEDADLLTDAILGPKGRFVYGAAACMPDVPGVSFPDVI